MAKLAVDKRLVLANGKVVLRCPYLYVGHLCCTCLRYQQVAIMRPLMGRHIVAQIF